MKTLSDDIPLAVLGLSTMLKNSEAMPIPPLQLQGLCSADNEDYAHGMLI
jgi:hypothetical protein